MIVFKQSIWEHSKGQHKTNKKLKIVEPTQKYCTSKQITKTNSTLNKVDCTQIHYLFEVDNYYKNGEYRIHSLIDDIVHGVSNLNTGNNRSGLSKHNLFYFLSSGNKIYLKDIQDYVGCEVRQARNYLKALKLCVLFIERKFSVV